MAEQLTLEQAAANVAKTKEKLDVLRKQRRELNEQLEQIGIETHEAQDAYSDATNTLLIIALQTKGDKQ